MLKGYHFRNGNITQAQFNEKLQGYQKDQMSAVKATKDARDAILDIVKDGITKESEAVQELIQKRKDDLSLQKEYYDFQKKMNDKSKEMNKIRAELAAMEGDNSLETVAKRKLICNIQIKKNCTVIDFHCLRTLLLYQR